MARIKGGLNAKKRHNRTLKLAKGYRGARSKQYRVAKQSVMRALTSSYAGRKQKKRQFRQLWIARINAAARMNGLLFRKPLIMTITIRISIRKPKVRSTPSLEKVSTKNNSIRVSLPEVSSIHRPICKIDIRVI